MCGTVRAIGREKALGHHPAAAHDERAVYGKRIRFRPDVAKKPLYGRARDTLLLRNAPRKRGARGRREKALLLQLIAIWRDVGDVVL